jgi:hypothetical protein
VLGLPRPLGGTTMCGGEALGVPPVTVVVTVAVPGAAADPLEHAESPIASIARTIAGLRRALMPPH